MKFTKVLKRTLAVCGSSIAVAAVVLPQAIGLPGVVQRMSPAPLWPKDGNPAQYPNQLVFLNPSASEYIVTYLPDGIEEHRRTVHVPAHMFVDGDVQTSVSRDNDGKFHYTYAVVNGPRAGTAIESMALFLLEDDLEIQTNHPTWKADVQPQRFGSLYPNAVRALRWQSTGSSRIANGSRLAEFSVVSSLAPGYLALSLSGHSDVAEPDAAALGSLPPDVTKQLSLCRSLAWNTQMKQVIGPRFAKNDSAEKIVENYLAGVQSQNRQQLLDASKQSPLIAALTSAVQNSVLISSADVEGLEKEASTADQSILVSLQLTLENARR